MDEFKLLACLPPKAGTTNWQRYFAALLDPDREPEDFDSESDEIYTVTPRVLSTYMGPKRKKVDFTTTEGLKNFYKNYTKLINVRHPLARLLSGKFLVFEQRINYRSLATEICKRLQLRTNVHKSVWTEIGQI